MLCHVAHFLFDELIFTGSHRGGSDAASHLHVLYKVVQ